MVSANPNVLDFARFRPKPAERKPQESTPDLMDELTSGEAATRIDIRKTHAIGHK
jgi:hypothetical protein